MPRFKGGTRQAMTPPLQTTGLICPDSFITAMNSETHRVKVLSLVTSLTPIKLMLQLLLYFSASFGLNVVVVLD